MYKLPNLKKSCIYVNYEQNFDSLKNWLTLNKKEFIETKGFSNKSLRYNGKTYKFSYEYTHPVFFHVSKAIKTYLEHHLKGENYMLLLNLSEKQRYLYKPKNILSGNQYDLQNAYTSTMYALRLLPEIEYKNMLLLKAKGININKILGFAMLGEKTVTHYVNGQIYERPEMITNPYFAVFRLLYYIVCSGFSGLYEYYAASYVCRYVDSALLGSTVNIDELKENYCKSFLKTLEKIQKYLNYHNINFNSLFDFENTIEINLFNIFNFHIEPCKSITYDTNTGIMQFYRQKENKPLERVEYHFSNLINNKKFVV